MRKNKLKIIRSQFSHCCFCFSFFATSGKQSILNKFDCKAYKLETKKHEALTYEKKSFKPKNLKQYQILKTKKSEFQNFSKYIWIKAKNLNKSDS